MRKWIALKKKLSIPEGKNFTLKALQWQVHNLPNIFVTKGNFVHQSNFVCKGKCVNRPKSGILYPQRQKFDFKGTLMSSSSSANLFCPLKHFFCKGNFGNVNSIESGLNYPHSRKFGVKGTSLQYKYMYLKAIFVHEGNCEKVNSIE